MAKSDYYSSVLISRLAARSFAQALGLSFKRAQFTPDLLPADLTGSFVFDQRTGEFSFRKGPLFTGLLLADEINRTPPKTQAALLEAMQERQITVEGETFFYLGRVYPLHIVESGNNPIERTDRLCVCRTLLPDIKHRLKCWYMQEAQREIHARCMWFSMMTGYSPTSIRITDACQRWGSCTHKGGLNFSWRLIQAPLEIVDYVIVHELVHLRQPDHSKKFWAKVKEMMPDYERRREWLRENERLLRI
jgi:predicted metal-dependent hydrolase